MRYMPWTHLLRGRGTRVSKSNILADDTRPVLGLILRRSFSSGIILGAYRPEYGAMEKVSIPFGPASLSVAWAWKTVVLAGAFSWSAPERTNCQPRMVGALFFVRLLGGVLETLVITRCVGALVTGCFVVT